MLKIKSKLGDKKCPICKSAISPYYSMVNRYIITEQEELFYDKMDVSQEFIEMKCNNCGYVMAFNTEILFR